MTAARRILDLARTSGRLRAPGAAAAIALALIASLALMLIAPIVGWAAEIQGPPPDDAAAMRRQVRALVAEAAHESQIGHTERARVTYREALAIAPGDEAARRGLAALEAVMAGRGDAADADLLVVRDQQTLAEARAALDQAELMAEAGRSADARDRLALAKLRLDQLADRAETKPELERLAKVSRRVEDDLSRGHDVEARTQRQQALAEAEQRAIDDRDHRGGLFAERMARIRAMRDHRHYELALAACRLLVVDYPEQPEAEQLFNRLLASAHAQRHLDIEDRNRELREEVNQRTEMELIPTGSDGLPGYPADWLQREGRGAYSSSATQLPDWHEALLDRLGDRLSFDFAETDFLEAIETIRRQTGINLVVDPALFAGGAHLVTLKANAMRLDSVLSWLAREAGTHWEITKGAISIGGTAEDEPVTEHYDIAHLAFQAVDQPGKTMDLAGGTAAGKGFSFTNPAAAVESKTTPEDLVDLIKNSVSPQTWQNPAYGIQIRSGANLFVTAPVAVHRLVQEFIRSKAHAKDVVVQVDIRWLEIQDGFLEEIGVDWGSADNLLRLGPAGRLPGGYLRDDGTEAYNGNVINVLPANAVATANSVATSGINLSMLKIGVDQISAVLKAVENKRQARLLAAPSIATLNGVRGNSFFGTQIAYISGYTVASQSLDPEISTLSIGVAVDVKPFVSADGKYVTMELRQTKTSVQFFVELIQGFIIRPAGVDINGLPLISAVSASYPIELPNLTVDEVKTTVTLPDHGNLLVGGFGKQIEQNTSAEVPFVGHIPFLGRLFGRRGRYSDRGRLYLLASVHIINYEEAEAHL